LNKERIFSTFPILAGLRNRKGAELSGGEQQILALARTLMGNPRILLLDEPCEGLAPIIVEYLFQNLLISSRRVAELIEHPTVNAVTLTGSVTAGRSVAEKAGKMLKKTVLELGGSDPYLILEDADLDKTVDTCVTSRLLNSGQSCIAAKRFVVVEAVHRQFEQMLVERMQARRMGDPLDEAVEIGSAPSFRRYQGKRLWAGTLPLRSQGIRQYQDRLHSIDRILIRFPHADDDPALRNALQVSTGVIWVVCHFVWGMNRNMKGDCHAEG